MKGNSVSSHSPFHNVNIYGAPGSAAIMHIV